MLRAVLFSWLLPLVTFAQSVSESDEYTGYKLDIRDDGDPTAVLYETANTTPNVSDSVPPPDVFLNASVHVGEIDIEVENLTAKINLDAQVGEKTQSLSQILRADSLLQVLQLLQFNAGVDLSVDQVKLTIQNVTAKVLLEARLANVVRMINDTLSSIDLNPIIATLGQDVGSIVNSTAGLLDGTTAQTTKRSGGALDFELANNILFSVNDYSGNTHRNRVLAQDGSLVDQQLDNDGAVLSRTTVGSYASDMTFNGFNRTVARNGVIVQEQEYVYTPYPGLLVIAAIFTDAQSGAVVATQVLSEGSGGGTSTISNDQGAAIELRRSS